MKPTAEQLARAMTPGTREHEVGRALREAWALIVSSHADSPYDANGVAMGAFMSYAAANIMALALKEGVPVSEARVFVSAMAQKAVDDAVNALTDGEPVASTSKGTS